MELNKIEVLLKTGDEKFVCNNKLLNTSMLDFWRWSASDLVSNSLRGVLAEFIVATATNIDTKIPREDWAAFDLTTPDGIKLEIKSAAYMQTWFQKKPSIISFSTKHTKGWDSERNKFIGEIKRHADVYVFCLLKHLDKHTINPLNMAQWDFFVLATKELNDYTRSQYSITLASLKNLTRAVTYEELNKAITNRHQRNV